jgi:general secretion pathway protein A
MYNHFFGLEKAPFNLTPDPSLLFMPTQHREALAGLTYAILNRKGFAVLIGEAGTGKTTLLARILRGLPASRLHASMVLNPTLTAAEFLELLLLDFGIANVPSSKAQRLVLLQRMLLQNHSANKVSVLIVDEAHKLSDVVLEEIRLLSNFEIADQKLLQIVLSGQSELAGVLNAENLRQLKQRIAIRLALGPLAETEVEQYIRYRWTKCGGAPAIPFSTEAVASIAAWSLGIPRLINAICDSALTTAFGQGVSTVDAQQIAAVAHDLDLKAPAAVNGKADHRAAPAMAAELPAARTPQEMSSIRDFDAEPTPDKHSLLGRWTRKLGLTQ